MGNFPFFVQTSVADFNASRRNTTNRDSNQQLSTPKTMNKKQTKSTSIRLKMSDIKITAKNVGRRHARMMDIRTLINYLCN